jgi:diaminopimelate epimerase
MAVGGSKMFDGQVIYKMTGSGNDFVFLAGRSESLEDWDAERIRAVCARGTGVGADGLVILQPGSEPNAVRFHFFNRDGGRAEMCGNAALCATRLAAWLDMADPSTVLLETDAGRVRGRCFPRPEERAEIELSSPSELTAPAIDLAEGEQAMRLATVGVPHLVVVVDDVSRVSLVERGRELRGHAEIGPDGANVNFLANGHGEWSMRTYERGVEAETLACGTGAVACAATLVAVQGVATPIDLRTASGSVLTVSAAQSPDGRLARPRLAGQARMVFRAILSGATDCHVDLT